MHRSTRRLTLRPPTQDDVHSVFAIYGDPATHRFNPAGPLKTQHHAAAMLKRWMVHWQSAGYGQWAIAERDAPDVIIGFGGLDKRPYGPVERLNLGYRFAVAAWGKGYATELSQASLDFGFAELDVPEVFAMVRPGHGASIRVLEKVGMRCIDTLDDVPGEPPSLVYRASRAQER
ncbi:GNAT family N-acetyltransferase [Pseudomonas sp. RIT-PI-S]|uniref:GNAT family N-acetyltransferase n=1 Tax=Pseudomonas sp. RIT-PI-S TaxID=3035295 RepID=UPI0021D93A73|nr:GNAT family N-acetyltransferase [Pseudomonas sp. RIT-PI-S]